MSWIDKIIQPIKRSNTKARSSVPAGVWQQCKKCNNAIYERTLTTNLGVCPKCDYHHNLEPSRRAQMIFDHNSKFREIGAELRTRDPLKFTDLKNYRDRIKQETSDDRSREAMHVYSGTLEGLSATIACFDFGFLGGSMGSVVGERFMRGIDECCDTGASFIVFCASGGARMQEGMLSLMQMAKTTSGIAELSKHHLPFISVLCDPTTGGVAASFALIADVVIAEPNARIGFAGARVIKDTVKQDLPEGFQSADFLLKHGGADMIVHRSKMRSTIASVISHLRSGKDPSIK